jgi:uncharacterized membrane protein
MSTTRTMDGWLQALTIVGALTTGLMAGLYFAFSVAVMPALARLDGGRGTEAMQSVNRAILNPLFLAVFLTCGLSGGALAVSSAWTWDQPGPGLRLAGGVLAFGGSLVLTTLYHVPRNNALDEVGAESPEGAAQWTRYLREWVPANHVRALACTVSLVLLLLASARS